MALRCSPAELTPPAGVAARSPSVWMRRSTLAALRCVFAGDRRAWRAAAVAAVPVVLLVCVYCLKPRPYYTGTNSVELYSWVAPTPAHAPLCVPGLQIPNGTARIRLELLSPSQQRPRLQMALELGGQATHSELGPSVVARASRADFAIPEALARRSETPASLCLTADGPVSWGGTSLPARGALAPTINGAPLAGRIAIWYLPRPGASRSYLDRAGDIFRRAALFRAGIVGAWTYPVLLLLILPSLGLLAVRLLALALAGRTRRLGAWLLVIAAVNACCWALITPSFQAPDEVDHFAYTQSLVERGEGPSHNPLSPLPRWSAAENLALQDESFETDHQIGDTRLPWRSSEQRKYAADVALAHPARNDGGGYTTSAAHGPLYYLALAPAYAATSHASVFAQLTLMRFVSALLGALVVLFTYLLARELAPGRPWLAVLAALLVAFEPMYGFVSGIVNNDVGVNACAAALEFLLICILRRGMSVRLGLLTGFVLIALPMVKGTGLSLYPVAALVFLISLWRSHTRKDLLGWGALVLGGVVMSEISVQLLSILQPAASATGSGAISSNASAVREALHHIPTFLSYLWQALLPRLPFMASHFPPSPHPGFVLFTDPAFVIFVERGWGAFGWYDVFFPKWVYIVIFLAMVGAIPLGALAARHEWSWVRRHWAEVVAMIAMPLCVIVGFVAAYYTPQSRTVIAEFGRYLFPAIGPIALLVVGALHAVGRRRLPTAATALLVGMIGLSYAAQMLTLTAFYA
jgi:hypothetical protein